MIRAYDEYGNIVDLVEWEKKIRSKAIDDFVAEFKNKDSELRKSCNNWYEFADRIAEQLKKEVGE